MKAAVTSQHERYERPATILLQRVVLQLVGDSSVLPKRVCVTPANEPGMLARQAAKFTLVHSLSTQVLHVAFGL